MRVLWRAEPGAVRSGFSFSISGLIHATLLGMVVFGNAARDAEPARSLYETAIRPQEKRVVWYHLQEKLPDVRAERATADRRPLRATRLHEQRIVAGAKDDAKAPQVVRSPLPEAVLPKQVALPNVLAVERRAPPREFRAATGSAGKAAEVRLAEAAAVELGAAPAGANLPEMRKRFVAPAASSGKAAAVKLSEAAPVGIGAAPAGANLPEMRKRFVAPAASSGKAAAVTLSEAAPVGIGAAPAGTNLREMRTDALVGEMPEAAKLAIVGLNATKGLDLTVTPESRNAGFSAGPVLNPKGAEADGAAAGISAPGVTVRDGISRQQLMAAVRPMANLKIPERPLPAATTTRVSASPDAALDGRVVYMMAIQMPNVTSYSGSWLVWYAAREQSQATMHAPSPVRKVDPKYIASAVADGVEGVVRLAATIRRDGRVEAVRLLRHLDDRLDRSAMESLAKWEFEPATRDGTPVEVDAVFEIPFRLAPKTPR